MRTLGTILSGAVAACVLTAIPVAVHADSNMTPDYEVKLLLPASLLSSSHQPGSALDGYLSLDSPESRAYQYLDTSAQDLDAQGWSVRERRIDGAGPLELNFKHRWAITNGNIDAALTKANADGFDSSDTNYDAQVDWGYTKQTLSIADDKSHTGGFTGTLPSGSTAVSLAVGEIPGKLDDWGYAGWGSATLQASRVHGPVTSTYWDGTLDGHDADVEVLPIRNAAGTGTEYVVELSFKADTLSQATSRRSQAISELDAKGWLVHADSLKTQLILDRY